MSITMTLSEILHQCNDWDGFCDEFGWSEWCVNEGGCDITQTLTKDEAKRYGVI